MSAMKKVADAQYFLTSFVTERGAIDRVVGLWKTHCKGKPTDEDRTRFVSEALLVLVEQPQNNLNRHNNLT